MAYAMPLPPPTRCGSKVNAIDESAEKTIPDCIGAIPINDPSQTIQGCAVVAAKTLPAAMKFAKAVNVDWPAGPTANVDEAAIIAEGIRIAYDPQGWHAGRRRR